jgi:uncharacterized membrane-anchored protein
MDINTTSVFNDQPQRNLPNATAVLVLGIISIILCCCYGGGVITSIIALVLAGKDMKLYAATPMAYTASSYQNLKTGRICAIISLILNILFIVFMVITIATVGMAALSDPDAMRELFEK